MNVRKLLLAGTVAALAGCNQAAENRSENVADERGCISAEAPDLLLLHGLRHEELERIA